MRADPYPEVTRISAVARRVAEHWPALHWDQVQLGRKRQMAQELEVLLTAAESEIREIRLGLRKWL